MGLFDNFIKSIDSTLKDIESGKLEERLDALAERLDNTSKSAIKATEKLADKPGVALHQAEQKITAVNQAGKRIDIGG